MSDMSLGKACVACGPEAGGRHWYQQLGSPSCPAGHRRHQEPCLARSTVPLFNPSFRPCSLHREAQRERTVYALARRQRPHGRVPWRATGVTATRDRPGPLGALLQRLRAAAGLSQEELAKRAGLSRRGISDLERGARRTPYPATVRRLSGALGLGLGERAALLAAAHRTPTGEMPIELEAEALTIDSQQHDLRTTWGTRVVDAELATASAVESRPPAALGARFDRPTSCSILIGRDADLTVLQGWLDRARGGTGQTILIAGEAGIGKSRLVAAAREHAIELGFGVLEGHCFEPDRALPYAPLADLLNTWLGYKQLPDVANGLSPEAVAAIVQLVPELASRLPAVALPTPLEPEPDKRRLFHP